MQLTAEYEASVKICALLVALIAVQQHDLQSTPSTQKAIRSSIRRERSLRLNTAANVIHEKLPVQLQRAVKMASEKGASIWLTSLPIADHGFHLSKAAFRDALSLRYGWTTLRLPLHCSCGASFTVDHALSCPCGSFPTFRHELLDMCAELLTETCHDVCIEPVLYPLSGNCSHWR